MRHAHRPFGCLAFEPKRPPIRERLDPHAIHASVTDSGIGTFRRAAAQIALWLRETLHKPCDSCKHKNSFLDVHPLSSVKFSIVVDYTIKCTMPTTPTEVGVMV